uniref:Uncharacterized protein n=1 Tax=Rhizophora mucronata TaxID=61149 RepID=A0A2P2M0H1_RHIMU
MFKAPIPMPLQQWTVLKQIPKFQKMNLDELNPQFNCTQQSTTD